MVERLFHITTRPAWERARVEGAYAPDSLAREGFIHLSEARQWRAVANRFYRGVPELVLLAIDHRQIAAHVVYEPADGDHFPHLGAALPIAAVIAVHDLPVADDGEIGTPVALASPRRPLSIGAGAVIVHDGRVLLVRNVRGVTRGRYLLPAGRVEPGELPDQAAAREAFEETHLRVAIDGLLGVRIWVMDDGEHNYFFMFQATLRSPVTDLRPNLDEIDDARFFSADELDALPAHQTWSGAIAIARKALGAEPRAWPNDAAMSDQSGVDVPERWRIWL